MPHLDASGYKPPRLFRNGHVQTIYAALVRYVRGVNYRRERMDTPDGDFLDLDYSEVGLGPYAILVHGLEGNANQPYMRGMVRALNVRGVNTVSINLRGCSGEMNRLLHAYDMGSTKDIGLVSGHIAREHPDAPQYLIGFSLGGNLVLKFLGEKGRETPAYIERAVAFSVPCDLPSTAQLVTANSNRIYFHQFMYSIQSKLKMKSRQFPGQINPRALEWSQTFREFDEYYSAALLGFHSADEYWELSSSKRFLENICVPALLVNAQDDPLISTQSFPYDIASRSEFLFLEAPLHGGHVGFVSFNPEGEYWSETRAVDFLLNRK
jgi:predicted alpha/beta-fold hydrolase